MAGDVGVLSTQQPVWGTMVNGAKAKAPFWSPRARRCARTAGTKELRSGASLPPPCAACSTCFQKRLRKKEEMDLE